MIQEVETIKKNLEILNKQSLTDIHAHVLITMFRLINEFDRDAEKREELERAEQAVRGV